MPSAKMRSLRASLLSPNGARRAPRTSAFFSRRKVILASGKRAVVGGRLRCRCPCLCRFLRARQSAIRDLSSRVMRALHDDPPLPLFYFHRCYRAMLRARLSIAHLLARNTRTPEKWRPQTLSYLRLAVADARHLEATLKRPADRKAAYPRASGGWLRPRAARKIR